MKIKKEMQRRAEKIRDANIEARRDSGRRYFSRVKAKNKK